MIVKEASVILTERKRFHIMEIGKEGHRKFVVIRNEDGGLYKLFVDDDFTVSWDFTIKQNG